MNFYICQQLNISHTFSYVTYTALTNIDGSDEFKVLNEPTLGRLCSIPEGGWSSQDKLYSICRVVLPHVGHLCVFLIKQLVQKGFVLIGPLVARQLQYLFMFNEKM